MARLATFVYGTIAYLVFLFSFLYAIGFVGDLVVPKAINDGEVGTNVLTCVAINLLLLAAFAVQHSVMARPAFKARWTKIVPAAIERSTYVLLASLLLLLMFWQWRPLPGTVWQVENPIGVEVLHALFWFGWVLVLLSTYLIDHFDLFGLRQVWLYARGVAYTSPVFRVSLLYRFVRHPLLLGFVIAFWSAPHMSQGRLLFAVVTTIYILVGIQFEEHDLEIEHGDQYRDYKRRVSMIIPMPPKK